MGAILTALTSLATLGSLGMSIATASGAMGGQEGAEMPAAPDLAAAEAKAREDELRRRKLMTKTLLTGPGGVTGEAQTGKKVLLGG